MCDTLVALGNATLDGSVIFAKNSDREPNEAHHILIMPAAEYPHGSMVQCTYVQIPQVEHTHAVLLAKPFWIWGAEMGANEHGVVIGNEAVFTKVPYDKKPGLIGMDFIRLALERCSTAYDAMQTIIALLEQYGQGGNCGFRNKLYYHNSFLIADHQDAWVLETAGKMWAVEKVKSIRWISNALTISNQWDLASKDLVSYAVDRKWCQSSQDFSFAGCYSDHLYTPLAYGRERHSCGTQLLQKAAGKITPRTMMAILRNHGSKGQPWPPDRGITGANICMHAGFGPVRSSQSVGSMVSRIEKGNAVHWVTATSAPCTSVFKPIWLDAGYPLQEPPPDGVFDPESLYWRHEVFHRRVLKNFNENIEAFSQERDELEEQFVERTLDMHSKTVEERRDFSQQCFLEAEEARQHWLRKIASIRSRKQRLLYELAWRGFDRAAKYRFKDDYVK